LIVDGDAERRLRLDVEIESDDDLTALEGALLAARAAELTKMRRRDDRLAFGYGGDSARETMGDEIDQAQRRWTMLDRLLTALKAASRADSE
jgi:hypothetical protein